MIKNFLKNNPKLAEFMKKFAFANPWVAAVIVALVISGVVLLEVL